MQNSDINALESMESAVNYNKYIFSKITSVINTMNIIDFGAGFGYFCDHLASNGKKVVAVETNQEAIRRLKQKNYETHSSLNDIKIRDKTVVSLNVLEHIKNDQRALDNLYNFMEAGEDLILYLPVSMSVWSDLDVLVSHYRRYSKQEIIEKLETSGYSILSMEYVDFVGWVTLLLMKFFRLQIGFDENKIKFYDRYIFRYLIFLDKFFLRVIGKNILVVASKK